MPPLGSDRARAEWEQTFGTNYRRLRRRGSDPIVRAYGATNPAEYFAVTSELFFTVPEALREQHPRVYERLRRVLRAGPGRARRRPAGNARSPRPDAAALLRSAQRHQEEGSAHGVRGRVDGRDAAGHRLDERLGLARPAVGAERRSRSGTRCARCARWRRTERYGRAFMPVTMEAVSQVAHDTEHFSSYKVSVARPDAPRRPTPPITSDPPEHHDHRRLLLPSFSAEEDRPDGGRAARVLPQPDRRARRLAAPPTRPSSTRSTSRCTASASCSACPSPTPTCSATGSSATSSSRHATTTVRAPAHGRDERVRRRA